MKRSESVPVITVESPRGLLNHNAAARYLAVSPSYLRKLRSNGEGPVAVRMGRRWTYIAEDLDEYARARRTAGRP